MENSIEKIWKEGFLREDALVAPKLNNLYDRKSNHFITNYKRLFKLNILWIMIGSSVFLIISLIVGFPLLGVLMFIILNIMAFVDKNLLGDLNKIDKNKTSYEYLKSFLNWWDRKNKANIFMARILYPYAFLSAIIGMYFMQVKGSNLGSILVNEIVDEFPNTNLIFGIPLIGIIAVIIISSLLLFLSEKIYKWDINLVYGRVMEKIEGLVSDMEELRK